MTPEQPPSSLSESTSGEGPPDEHASAARESDARSKEESAPAGETSPATESESSSPPESTRYLVGVEYEDRAERRRVEYRLENWDGEVQQLPPLTRLLQGEEFFELYSELRETVDDPSHLSVYEVSELSPTAEELTTRIDRVYDVEVDRLEWAFQSLLDHPKRSVSQLDESTYEIHSDVSADPVTLDCHLQEVQQGAQLELTLTGPAPAPNAVKDSMLQDLGYLLPEPQEVFDR